MVFLFQLRIGDVILPGGILGFLEVRIRWHRPTFPHEETPDRRTLYKFLKDQSASWFVPDLLLESMATARVSRILVPEQQANLIQVQTLQLNAFLSTEQKMQGLPMPEVRANVELLDRMLERHKITQQEFGLAPKVTPSAKDAGHDDPDGHKSRELHDLVAKINELPPEEFLPTLVALIGPPPVKQPLQLGEAVVVERKPLQTDDAPIEEERLYASRDRREHRCRARACGGHRERTGGPAPIPTHQRLAAVFSDRHRFGRGQGARGRERECLEHQ